MELFTAIDDASVIIRKGRLLRQERVYRRGAHLYIRMGGWFVQLLAKNKTRHPDIGWDEHDVPNVEACPLGRLVVVDA